MSHRTIVILAVVLLAVFLVPGAVLGLLVAPWFFLIMVAAMFVPLLFLAWGDKAEGKAAQRH